MHYRPLRGRNLREIARLKLPTATESSSTSFGLDPSGRLLKVLSWKLFHRNRFESDLDRQAVTPLSVDWEGLDRAGDLSITYLKHASLMIQDAGSRILVDPVFSSPFWFIRDYTPLGFNPAQIPAPELVLLTHGHGPVFLLDFTREFPLMKSCSSL